MTVNSRQFRAASSDHGDLPATFGNWENTQPWTVYERFNPTSKVSGAVIGKYDATLNRGWIVFQRAGVTNSQIAAQVCNSGAIAATVATTTEYAPGTFHKVAVIYSGNGLASGFTIRVDGVNQAVTTIDNNLAGATILNTKNAQVGSRGGVGASVFFGDWTGRRLAVFSRALSTAEIDALDAGTSVPTDLANCVGWWEMGPNDDGINVMRDMSENRNTLALTGTVTSVADPSVATPANPPFGTGTARALMAPFSKTPTGITSGKTSVVLNNQGYLTNGATPTGTAGDQIGPGCWIKRNGKYFGIMENATGVKSLDVGNQPGVFDFDTPTCSMTATSDIAWTIANQGVAASALVNCNNVGGSAAFKTAVRGETSGSDLIFFSGFWWMLFHGGNNSGVRKVYLLKYTGALDVDGFPSAAGSWAVQNSGNPIIDVGAAASWEESGIADAYFLRNIDGTPVLDGSGRISIFYAGWNTAGAYQIGLVQTTDMVTFTKEAANPVLAKSSVVGAVNSGAMYPNGFSHVNGVVLALVGVAPSTAGTDSRGVSMFYASLSDLTTWTEGTYNPVFFPTGAANLEAVGSTTGFLAVDGTSLRIVYRCDNAVSGASGFRGRNVAGLAGAVLSSATSAISRRRRRVT